MTFFFDLSPFPSSPATVVVALLPIVLGHGCAPPPGARSRAEQPHMHGSTYITYTKKARSCPLPSMIPSNCCVPDHTIVLLGDRRGEELIQMKCPNRGPRRTFLTFSTLFSHAYVTFSVSLLEYSCRSSSLGAS